jgi:pimeloyl-ACP methyl ester carboxylesterase
MRTSFIFINGIFTNPGKKDAWTDLAVNWVTSRIDPSIATADKYEYLSGAVMRHGWIPFRDAQLERAVELAAMVHRREKLGDRVVLVGHSNGCQLIAYLVASMALTVSNAHLIAPAAFAKDFQKAIDADTVDRVFLYGGKRDVPLSVFAPISRLLTFGLSGYGSLGAHTEELAAPNPDRVVDCSEHDFGHSSWFTKEQFGDTMRLIMWNERIPMR